MKPKIISVGRLSDFPRSVWSPADRARASVHELPPGSPTVAQPTHTLGAFGGLHEKPSTRAERRTRAVDDAIAKVRGRTVRASSYEVDEALARLGVRSRKRTTPARLDPGVVRRDLGAVVRVR
jgi:hypothetical protein